ncbi:hypothetical protein FE374_01955 [Georgenia yuyongxinii]|uniref:histidine kinase n=1 Tax=Georgenia yuyongxinii TaxID=2589797 RepID=A0A5B8BZ19_9MICO|nr:histidine kinase [Georgenia yuyongxinii]QDC23553.1 hypothetical protein FE374_01955 [Georgenia yuyongxinii]
MKDALRFRTPWLAAAGCALATAVLVASEWFVGDRDAPPSTALLLAVPMTFGAVLLLWVQPWLGALLTIVGYGLTTSSAAWMPGVLVTFFMVGRREPAWRGWALIFAAIAAFALSRSSAFDLFADTAYGVVLFGGLWALGRAVRYRSQRAAAARVEAERTAAEDPLVLAAVAVAQERERLGGELVVVVRQAVSTMRDDAGRAASTLDGDDITRVATRGTAAVTDMRRMLGLLRDPADEEATTARHHLRGPRRSPGRLGWVDALSGAVIGALAMAEIVTAPEFSGYTGDPITLLPLLLLGAAIAVRRRWPVASAALVVATLTSSLLPGAASTIVTALLLALALLGWTTGSLGRRSVWIAFGCTLTAAAVVVALTDPSSVPTLAVPIAAAATGRAWSLRESEQEAHERRTREHATALDAATTQARQEERRRIALELHDVTSHALGVMVLHAGAAEATFVDHPEVARAALDQVVATGEEALVELDRLAATIGASPDPSVGAPLEARIVALADRMRAAGLRIDVSVSAEPTDPAVAHAVYRVVQEGLTNSARHAPGSRVSVRVEGMDDDLAVSVENDAPRGAPAGAGSGFGLAGAAERIRTMGGGLAAEATSAGGFLLRARLPQRPDRAVPRRGLAVNGGRGPDRSE